MTPEEDQRIKELELVVARLEARLTELNLEFHSHRVQTVYALVTVREAAEAVSRYLRDRFGIQRAS